MPVNHALSGMVSKSLGLGTQTNHLALDDTQDRMQVQLASDHGKSSVSLGYITRIDGHVGRQDARGEGFELRTDKHGAVWAAPGLLLTTFGRTSAKGKVKENGEAIARLTAARDIHESAAQEAQRHGAQEALKDQAEVSSKLKSANASLKGSAATQPDDFPEFDDPDIAIASAANLHATAAGSTHFASEHHTAMTTGGHVSIAAGRSFFASVREKIALYAQKALTFITPGPVHIESLNGPLSQVSQGDMSITSTDGILRLAALRGVDIQCNGTLWRFRPRA